MKETLAGKKPKKIPNRTKGNQWRREEVKTGGGYFENGRKCEIFRKSEKILDGFSPKFRGF
jgi:hypothetical protein